jgi:hypothetical protein
VRSTKAVAVAAVVSAAVVSAAVLGSTAAGAVGYDRSNPTSTGCNTKGQVDETRTAGTFGAWNVRIRRSTGCNTAWALVSRTDGKKCNVSTNCAKVKITRVKTDGTSVSSTRRQASGTVAQYSLQFGAVVGARYTASATTVGGAKIGSSKTLRYNADGTWSLV